MRPIPQLPAASGRWVDALRFLFGRRRQGQQEQERLLQAQGARSHSRDMMQSVDSAEVDA